MQNCIFVCLYLLIALAEISQTKRSAIKLVCHGKLHLSSFCTLPWSCRQGGSACHDPWVHAAGGGNCRVTAGARAPTDQHKANEGQSRVGPDIIMKVWRE